ncbi:D-hexose-6-phosphate mutarotase [Kocuria sp.]|uniref:D-hexose-6-phosphate mutarotase n=1 Tax=Kocuria sp. TaxID=1871328 RepID=UPI0026E0B895|nr:D-hexose-6-phosphate mutarotase [Kocuria sp.]MDO5618596.1 D-hexose-6-phosphate mutarotase [Kocuria sp.]
MTALQQPLALANDSGIATVYQQGAHVASWTPARQDPVLFLSRQAHFVEGKAIRGGVPICFPWFGPGRHGDRTPAHGYARTTPWYLDSSDDAVAVFSLSQDDFSQEARAAFPHAFACRYTVTVGAELKLELATTNTGDQPLEIEEALHTYLAVGDIRSVTVEGLDGVDYVDKVSGEDTVTQDGAVTFTGETDRVYRSGETLTVLDPLLGRKLHITMEGAANTVVWNPWTEKARAMGDFADEEWTQMLCVEGANALNDYVTVAPGDTHRISYKIAVESLE